MESTTYTVDGKEFELQHHGVKGMKWGVRKKRQDLIAESADRKIRRYEKNNTRNELNREKRDAKARSKYSNPNQTKKLAKSLARSKAIYDDKAEANRYFIAVQKARKDESYKNSSEYLSAKRDYGKSRIRSLMYGQRRNIRYKTLVNQGMSEKRANGKVVTETVLATLGGLTVQAILLRDWYFPRTGE